MLIRKIRNWFIIFLDFKITEIFGRLFLGFIAGNFPWLVANEDRSTKDLKRHCISEKISSIPEKARPIKILSTRTVTPILTAIGW